MGSRQRLIQRHNWPIRNYRMLRHKRLFSGTSRPLPQPQRFRENPGRGAWEVRVTGSGHLQGNICWTRQGHGTHELSGCDSMHKTCADMMKPVKFPACMGERFLPLTQRLLATELLDEGV